MKLFKENIKTIYITSTATFELKEELDKLINKTMKNLEIYEIPKKARVEVLYSGGNIIDVIINKS